MTTLLVRGSADVELDTWPWTQLDAMGRVLAEGCLANPPPASRLVCLVLPDTHISYAKVKLPEGRLRKSVSALAYAVEDLVIDEVDELHVVVIDTEGKDSLHRVAIIKRTLLGDAIHRLRERGIEPDCAIPQALLGNANLQAWTVYWTSENCILRTGSTEVVCLDEPMNQLPPRLLSLKLKDVAAIDKRPQRIDVFAERMELIDQAAWADSLQLPLQFAGKPDWRRLPQQQGRVGNLLGGDFQPPRKISFDWLDKGRMAAMAFALAGAIGFAGYSVYAGRLLVEKLVLESRMQAMFKDLFPDESQPVNPAQAMRRNLADLRHRAGVQDTTDLVPMLSRIVETAKNTKAGVRNLSYLDGHLELDVVFPSADSLAENANAIRASGMEVTVLDVQPSGSGQQARIAVDLEKAGK